LDLRVCLRLPFTLDVTGPKRGKLFSLSSAANQLREIPCQAITCIPVPNCENHFRVVWADPVPNHLAEKSRGRCKDTTSYDGSDILYPVCGKHSRPGSTSMNPSLFGWKGSRWYLSSPWTGG